MPSGAVFAREPWVSAWPDIEPLSLAHWSEVKAPDDVPPDLLQEAYRTGCEQGRFVALTARVGSVLAGYALWWVGRMPQEQRSIGAWQDAVYVRPEFRRLGVGVELLRFCDEFLASIGVNAVFASVRAGRDFGPVLTRMGYTTSETIYSKRLA